MKTKPSAAGIIVEYNPFHNGHIYHIEKTRQITQCDVLIAVMSPNFVQRGEPAFIDKWMRTEAALDHGVDLVIELPTYYALQSADYFAKAAVELLNIMDVDSIVFGSESNDKDAIMSQFTFKKDASKSYAKQMGEGNQANDILGYHYILNAERFGIETHTIQRTNSYADANISNTISSATAIRKNHRIHDTSHTTPLRFDTVHTLDEYEALIRYKLSTSKPEDLQEILLVDEGIENLLIKHKQLPINAMIDACTSTRYTTTRIQRTLMNILLNIKKSDVLPITQARVLGMNAKGQAYLKHIKNDDHKVVTSFKHYIHKDLERKATEVYALVKSQTYQDELLQKEIQELIRK